MTPKLERLRHKIDIAKQTFADAVAEAQKTCEHKRLEECGYQSLHYSSLVPLRVCTTCGMTEEGWGCGYVVLKGDALIIKRDDLYEKRAGLAIRDEHKGPLLRREVTVAELVERHFAENRHVN